MDYSNSSSFNNSNYPIPYLTSCEQLNQQNSNNNPQTSLSYVSSAYQNSYKMPPHQLYSTVNLFSDMSPYNNSTSIGGFSTPGHQPCYYNTSPEYNSQYSGIDLRSNVVLREDVDFNNNHTTSHTNGYQIDQKSHSSVNNSTHSLLSDILDVSEHQLQSQPVDFELTKHLVKEELINDRRTHDDNGVKIPKKRGPKKKPLTKEREMKLKVRRMRANTRERNRMHSLNDALEELRTKVPTFSTSQRLSKIETLRLARNYIIALDHLLKDGGPGLSLIQMAMILTNGLTQNTTNLICGQLKVNTNDLLNLREKVKVPTIMVGEVSELSTYFTDEQILQAFTIIENDYPLENQRNADYSELLKCLGLLRDQGNNHSFNTTNSSSNHSETNFITDYSFGLIQS